jgi:hypothetical protein
MGEGLRDSFQLEERSYQVQLRRTVLRIFSEYATQLLFGGGKLLLLIHLDPAARIHRCREK